MPTEITDEEVNALVLTSLFGWRWMSNVSQMSGNRLTDLIAPEGDLLGYSPTNWYASDWTHSDAAAPRFSDWNRSNVKRSKNDHILTTVLPDFCTDRNLLPMLWAKIKKAQAEYEFGEEIYLMVGPYVSCSQWGIRASLIDIMELTPRQQTEAVLRTLGRWPKPDGGILAISTS